MVRGPLPPAQFGEAGREERPAQRSERAQHLRAIGFKPPAQFGGTGREERPAQRSERAQHLRAIEFKPPAQFVGTGREEWLTPEFRAQIRTRSEPALLPAVHRK